MREDKPRLLIIEDDEGLQAQLKWAYDDFAVTIVGDRDSAIAALRAEEPDVVTLDLGLSPDPDGTSEGFAVLDAIMVGGECGLDEGLEFEAAQFGLMFATEDMREGTRAFLERRKPAFQGR